jgi:hypothetical protein
MPAAARGRGGAKVGGELGDQRLQRDAAIFLELGIMVAVDDGERVDPALDRGVGGRDLLVGRAAGVEVEQRRDHLEVVLDPVVDLADQPGLPLDRGLELGLVAGDGPDHLRTPRRARRSRAPGWRARGRLMSRSPGR